MTKDADAVVEYVDTSLPEADKRLLKIEDSDSLAAVSVVVPVSVVVSKVGSSVVSVSIVDSIVEVVRSPVDVVADVVVFWAPLNWATPVSTDVVGTAMEVGS